MFSKSILHKCWASSIVSIFSFPSCCAFFPYSHLTTCPNQPLLILSLFLKRWSYGCGHHCHSSPTSPFLFTYRLFGKPRCQFYFSISLGREAWTLHKVIRKIKEKSHSFCLTLRREEWVSLGEEEKQRKAACKRTEPLLNPSYVILNLELVEAPNPSSIDCNK